MAIKQFEWLWIQLDAFNWSSLFFISLLGAASGVKCPLDELEVWVRDYSCPCDFSFAPFNGLFSSVLV